MSLRRRLPGAGAVAAGLALLACGWAFARAGGGEGFSGGFSGGGGGDAGGDGVGLLIYLLLRLTIEHPALGVPLLIVVAVVVYRSSKGVNSAYVSSTIRRGLEAGRIMRAEEGLEGLWRRDPAFSLDAFLQRCRVLLPAVQSAWSRQDMSPVRHFLSDGVFDRFALQIDMQKGCGIRNDMRNVRVLDVHLVGSSSDRYFDVLHIAVMAEAVDTTVALGDGRRLQGSGALEDFTEIWTFLRRPGAQTLARPGLLEGFCPNCGAPLKISTSVACASCQALVNSGEYDWVLTEITQREAWSAYVAEPVQGLEALQQRDPGFNPQAIEDRVSAIFWHYRAAEFFGSEEHLRAVALPAFVEEVRKGWQPDEHGRHVFYADAAVGAVTLAEVLLGADGGDMDRVRVLVKWSGHRVNRKVPGVYAPEWEQSGLLRQDFVLARKCGVQSVQAAALTSLHCPGCGAPQVAKMDGSCRYCGLPQNDGSTSWVLESVSAFSGFAAVAAPRATEAGPAGVLLSPKEREAMLQCVIAVMLADGVVDPREERLLRQMAVRQKLPLERVDALGRQMQADSQVELPPLGDCGQRSAFFKLLIQMCLADGNVSSSERLVLRALTDRLGYQDIDIDLMITRERAELYAASKALLKADRGRATAASKR